MTTDTKVQSTNLMQLPSAIANQLAVKEQEFITLLETKQKGIINIGNVARWAAMIGICAVVGPIVYLAIKGLVGLAAFGVVAYTGYHAAPIIALKVTNAKILALESERNAFYRALDAERNAHLNKVARAAAEDPIATAKNQSAQYKKRAAESLKAITAYSTEVKNFGNMTEQFTRKYPDNAGIYKDQHKRMKAAHELKEGKYKELMGNIERMDEQIEFLEANWNMSQALQKANALGGIATIDPMEQVKANAAIEAVRNSVNTAFAEMDSIALQDSVVKAGTPYDRSGLIPNNPQPIHPENTKQSVDRT
jgi:hypothetical protein